MPSYSREHEHSPVLVRSLLLTPTSGFDLILHICKRKGLDDALSTGLLLTYFHGSKSTDEMTA